MPSRKDTSRRTRWLLLQTGVSAARLDGRKGLATIQCRALAALRGLGARVETDLPTLGSSVAAPLTDDDFETVAGQSDCDAAIVVDVVNEGRGFVLICRTFYKGEIESHRKLSSMSTLFRDAGRLTLQAILGDLPEEPADAPDEAPAAAWATFYLATLASPEVRNIIIGADGVSPPKAADLVAYLPDEYKHSAGATAVTSHLDQEPLALRPDWAVVFAEVAALMDPSSPEPDRVLGELAAFGEQSKSKAETHFKRAIDKAEEAVKPEIRLGWAKCCEFLGDAAAAEAVYRELQGGSLDLEAQHGLARLADRKGDASAAHDWRSEACKAHPSSAAAHFELANSLRGRGDFETARAHYRRALELDGALSGTIAAEGFQLLESGRPDLAASVFEQLVEIAGESPLAYFGLGQAAAELGDAESAEDYLRRVIDLSRDPSLSFQAASALASLFAAVGMNDEAAAQWEEARRYAQAAEKAAKAAAESAATPPETTAPAAEA